MFRPSILLTYREGVVGFLGNWLVGPTLKSISIHYFFEGWHPTTQVIKLAKFQMWIFNGARLFYNFQINQLMKRNSPTINLLITLLYNLPITIQVCKCCICFPLFQMIDLGVSKNSGTPKSSILIGFSIINHPFWGTPSFGNTHLLLYQAMSICCWFFLWEFLSFSKSKGLPNPRFLYGRPPSLQDGAHSGDRHSPWKLKHPHRIHGSMVYLPTWMVDVYG